MIAGIVILTLTAIGAARVIKVSLVGVRASLELAKRASTAIATRAASAPDVNVTTIGLCALVAILVACMGSK